MCSTAQAQFTKVLGGGLGATASFECRVANAEGQWLTVDVVVTNLLDEPDVGAIVLNSRDVTDRRALEQELNRQAFHDTLTGLANRALFLDRLSHAMDRGDRGTEPVAVLFLDIDDFKTINDSLGHPAGDHLLVAVAGRLKGATRPGDTVARFGGDEFAVLVESGTMPEAAEVVASASPTPLFRPSASRTTTSAVRASIGIALGRRPQESPDDLLRDADLAMYLAKRNGKGRFEMYRPDMHTDAINRLETAADLRGGLEAGQFEVFYQAIVNTHTRRLTGAEALVRWRHPSRGLVAPMEFIPIAEVTGLIVPLGRQVLRDATLQAQAWRQSGLVDEHFYVSVNLSARQLQDPELLDGRLPRSSRLGPRRRARSSWKSPRAPSSRISTSPCPACTPSKASACAWLSTTSAPGTPRSATSLTCPSASSRSTSPSSTGSPGTQKEQPWSEGSSTSAGPSASRAPPKVSRETTSSPSSTSSAATASRDISSPGRRAQPTRQASSPGSDTFNLFRRWRLRARAEPGHESPP